MSNPQVITRANQNSSLYQSIKARNSKQNVFDYAVSGEKNICPVSRSKVVVNSTSTMTSTNQQKIVFELPNYGILTDLYVKTKFNSGAAGQNIADGSKGVALSEFAGAFAWTACRLVFQGTTIFTWTPEWVMTSQYTRAGKEKATQLDMMLGGGIIGAENGTLTSRTGRRLVSSTGGGIELIAPLKAFWSDSLGRGFDLYSLNSKVHLEIDYRQNSQIHAELDDTTMACTYAGSELICYLAEMPPEELSSYQSRNYIPGSVSSQLGFTTTHLTEAITPVVIGDSTTGNRIKLNAISGLCRRLYCYVNLTASETANSYFLPVRLAGVKVLANNLVIHEQNDILLYDAEDASAANSTGYKAGAFMEMYHNNLPMACFAESDPATNLLVSEVGGGTADISRVAVINFGYSPDDYSSADGSVSFGALSNIELELFFAHGATGGHTVHVIAEMLTLNTYNTSNTGAITFKSIGE